ncbi:hypothetical protein N7447_005483 [Penicillium robsamsonii]|uniref:uncharacterized protein n=1 Tax=Penicillium robsamsonii TaxID=1792511 RepID=UPI002548DB94|nr:uncharacterized protein N7447_005483 [Penicillium robsamsonii]KAJ5823143.1 hypothetical protein N7447_005483 [Penicillium robsamsonii]
MNDALEADFYEEFTIQYAGISSGFSVLSYPQRSLTLHGSDERPSSMELFVLVALTYKEMAEVHQNGSDKCYFTSM